jgi:ribosomal protein S18 acetylase RimI-like enzyme
MQLMDSTQSRLDVEIRTGGPRDVPVLLALFDEAIEWLVARGQTGQWGDQPYSSRSAGVDLVERLAGGSGLRIAESAGNAVGALVISSAPEYVPPSNRVESYVLLLLTSRKYAGRGIGTRLIEHAAMEAQEHGCVQLRVDCWAEALALIAWYERNGFRRSGTYELNGWRGQIFTMTLADR